MKTFSVFFCAFRALALPLFAVCLVACRPALRESGALPHEIYIWQRIWTPAVAQAIVRSRDDLAGFVPLGAEIDWRNGKPIVTKPKLDYPALAACGRPIGVALRIGAFTGPFQQDDRTAKLIAALAASLVEDAAAHGVSVHELQIDFDCAESKLDGYREWIRAIRARVKTVPVCITVLPSWLKQRAFKSLAAEAGGYVLQVHSVAPPTTSQTEPKLCDPARAQAWVETAGRLGVPFRVALPTYTCLLTMTFKENGDAAGRDSLTWPNEAPPLRAIGADANELYALVRRWTNDRPACLRGIIWYRLPVDTDTLNWRWPTLAAIVRGHAPKHALRVEASRTQPVDLSLINDGETDEPLPREIEVSWQSGSLSAADGLNGFAFQTAAKNRAHFALPSEKAARQNLVPAGARQVIGWLRLEPEEKVDVRIVKNKTANEN